MLCEGRANSRPGSLRVLEMTWMVGPGFSLCAAPLESSGPVFQSGVGRTTVERMEVWSIPDQRERENLVSKRGQDLVGNLVDT